MILAIGGPTGVGKSRLAIELAARFGGEVVSADSVQIYRGLDIGSAKVAQEARARIPHHLVDIVEPTDDYSVACFQRDARERIRQIRARGNLPILVGGTGFYQKSVLHDFTFTDTKRDETFEKRLAHLPNEALKKRLEKADPKAAAKIHENDRRRLLHALSRVKRGNPLGESRAGETPLCEYTMIVLTMPREKLHHRIGKRVDAMFDEGLLEEARSLFDLPERTKAEEAIGYKECFAFFDGLISLSETKELIKRNTRRFAKRQLTYFKNQFYAHWLEVDPQNFGRTFRQAAAIVERAAG